MIRFIGGFTGLTTAGVTNFMITNEQLVIVSNFAVAITTLLLFWVSTREMLNKLSASQKLMLKIVSLFISENKDAKHRLTDAEATALKKEARK